MYILYVHVQWVLLLFNASSDLKDVKLGRGHNSVSRTVSATLKYPCEFKTFIRHHYVDNKEFQPFAKLLHEIKRRQKSYASLPLMLHCFRLLAVPPGARGACTLRLV
jgi:hypothetical protein